jgi:8-hydroxy-5-deazaflavin:NADPH oxidoreductase
MNIGIIGGTGPAGQGLALRFASAGFKVTVGSRDADRAQSVVAELLDPHAGRSLDIRGGSNADAADGDTVVLATPWDAAAPTAASLVDHLGDKLVICMANALARVGKEFYALYPPRGSIAADVQATIPGAHVVAAFQHLPARELADIDTDMEGHVLVCADRLDALDETIKLIESLPNLRGLDCGSLANAGPVEAFTAVLLQLNRRYRTLTSISINGIP